MDIPVTVCFPESAVVVSTGPRPKKRRGALSDKRRRRVRFDFFSKQKLEFPSSKPTYAHGTTPNLIVFTREKVVFCHGGIFSVRTGSVVK